MTKQKKGPFKRESFQCKKVKKGHKSTRGVSESESELKKAVGYSLTPTAQEKFKAIAREQDSSASQLLEDIARERYILIKTEKINRIRKSLPPGQLEVLDILIQKECEEKESK